MTEEIKNQFEQALDECMQKENGFKEDFDSLDQSINSEDDLNELLPILGQKAQELKNIAKKSSDTIKMWNENKKLCELKEEFLLEYAKHLLERFNLKSIKNGDVKLAKTVRNVLSVNSDAIISGYKALIDSVAKQLPSYIKLTMTVDKKEMAEYVKKKPDFLNDCPDLVHWEESESISLK